jgi:YidC/Oxa1 family membrane protein insertase
MDKNQRRLMLLLPLVFVFIVIGFPSGVLVYWITTNLWTMGQQYFIRRRLGPMTPITATADGDAAAAKGAPAKAEPSAAPNGAPTGGGLGGLLRGLTKGEEQREAVATTQPKRARTSAPPPPPRKKKKRSGRRR